MKTLYISVSDEEYQLIKHEAKSKGLKPAAFGRMAIFSYVSKYPAKGVFAELDTLMTGLAGKTSPTPINIGSQAQIELVVTAILKQHKIIPEDV